MSEVEYVISITTITGDVYSLKPGGLSDKDKDHAYDQLSRMMEAGGTFVYGYKLVNFNHVVDAQVTKYPLAGGYWVDKSSYPS
jgi:hypothetical protein